MEIDLPAAVEFTVYSKSGCINCHKIKKLIEKYSFFLTEVNCDEYLIEDKESFKTNMKNMTGREFAQFPVVFYEGKFVGDYQEATKYIEGLALSFSELF